MSFFQIYLIYLSVFTDRSYTSPQLCSSTNISALLSTTIWKYASMFNSPTISKEMYFQEISLTDNWGKKRNAAQTAIKSSHYFISEEVCVLTYKYVYWNILSNIVSKLI